LILELFRGSFYAHDVGSEIDNIFPALPTIFWRQQRATAKGKGQRRQRGTEWACLVFSDRWVRDNEKLSAFVELERQGRFISNQFMPIRYTGTE
jgi:hypothetical protein